MDGFGKLYKGIECERM